MLLIQPDHQEEVNSLSNLSFFLLRYSFLLTETHPDMNFFKRHFPNNGDISTQNSNVARYLDPKYSRWISVDPALGEYVPSAGKSNEADKLPGMGGIFNSVNLSLYHYAGNNPIRYVDPDGRIQHDALEMRFIREVLGEKGLEIYNKTTFVWVPKISELIRPASWDISDGIIFLTSDIYSRPMASDYGRETLIHELYHQIQYADSPKGLKMVSKNPYKVPLPNNLTIRTKGAFPDLIYEFKLNNEMAKIGVEGYSYNYNIYEIEKLSDLTYLEAQAELVGDFAKYYYNERYSSGIYFHQQYDMKRMAEILKNSGFDTEAVRWVLENYQ